MAAPKFEVLEQEVVYIDDVEYVINAMPATKGLAFMSAHQEALESGKPDISLMKNTIVENVCRGNNPITNKDFDIIFSRKYDHLGKVFEAVLKFNFPDLFQQPDTEE